MTDKVQPVAPGEILVLRAEAVTGPQVAMAIHAQLPPPLNERVVLTGPDVEAWVRPADWPVFLRSLSNREAAWNRRVTASRADVVPFMPYALPLFVAAMTEAIQVVPASRCYSSISNEPRQLSFLDVGCGPGTKMLAARALFQMDVHGIDIEPEYVSEARSHGLAAVVADAFTWGAYGFYDIVYVNRPSTRQDELERLVCEKIAPGTVLVGVNWRHNPAKWGLREISVEWGEPVRGVWLKSEGVTHREPPGVLGTLPCCGRQTAELPQHDQLTPDEELVTCRGAQE